MNWAVAVGSFIGVFAVFAAGYFWALFVVARDKTWMKVPDDCIVVKKELLIRLQKIAEIKTKNPRLKFDSRGILKDPPAQDAQEDEDEDA